MRLIDEKQKIHQMFWVFLTMLLHINMKNHENSACTFFENVNIALTARKTKILLVPVN